MVKSWKVIGSVTTGRFGGAMKYYEKFVDNWCYVERCNMTTVHSFNQLT